MDMHDCIEKWAAINSARGILKQSKNAFDVDIAFKMPQTDAEMVEMFKAYQNQKEPA